MLRDLPEDDEWIRSQLGTVGRRIRAERQRQGLTQEAVYLAAGLDRRTLQAIEAGTGNPTLITLMRLAYVLGASGADFIP